MTTQTQTERVISEFNNAYGQNITEEDIYVFEQKVYLSTSQVAKLFKVSNHYFSVIFSKEIKSKVKTLHQGRNRWYCLKQVVDLHKKSIKDGVSVKSLCQPVKLRKKKK